MIPPRPTIPQRATSAVDQVLVFTPLTTGIKTFASISTPNVIEIIPETSGFAILLYSPQLFVSWWLLFKNTWVFKGGFSLFCSSEKIYMDSVLCML